MARISDKYERLVEAAKILIHEQGFNLTTLADIAQKADVPLGNIYYYFKTKEAIAMAVLAIHEKELSARLHSWELLTDLNARFSALLNYEVAQAESTARSGCVIGSLCQELAKQGGVLADAAAKLLRHILGWCEKQLRKEGYSREQAANLAHQFIALVQGTAVMTHAFQDPQIPLRMVILTEQWLRDIDRKYEQEGEKHCPKVLNAA